MDPTTCGATKTTYRKNPQRNWKYEGSPGCRTRSSSSGNSNFKAHRYVIWRKNLNFCWKLQLSLKFTHFCRKMVEMKIIHGQAKKVTWGVSSQGAMLKICRPPSAAGKFFTWGASSLGTFAIFKLSAPILEGGGTHFTLGSVHFSPFLLRELQGRVKKFSAALPRRHPREAAPPYFFTSGVDQKNFFTQGCTPPPPFAHVWFSLIKISDCSITYYFQFSSPEILVAKSNIFFLIHNKERSWPSFRLFGLWFGSNLQTIKTNFLQNNQTDRHLYLTKLVKGFQLWHYYFPFSGYCNFGGQMTLFQY